MLFNQAKKNLNRHKKNLTYLGVRALALFGSVARNEGSSKSDVDVLIDFDPKKGIFAFVSVKNYLESLLGCDVDLVTKSALHPALKNAFCKKLSMSSREWSFRVLDILQAIDKIRSFIKKMTFNQFKKMS